MEVTFLENTWIRKSIEHSQLSNTVIQSNNILGYIKKGKSIEVEDTIYSSTTTLNELVNNVKITSNQWVKCNNGWYYWYGSTMNGFSSLQASHSPNEIRLGNISSWNSVELSASNSNWGMRNLGIQETFWNERNISGKGIKIAILDDGVPKNLQNVKVAKEIHFGIPKYSHGVKCATIMSGNGTTGIFGLAPDAEILSYTVCNDMNSKPNPELLVRAMEDIIQNHKKIKIDIINMSFFLSNSYLGVFKDILKKLITEATELGIICVASQGNVGFEKPYYPACFKDCLSIGGYEINGKVFHEMPKNNCLDILSPSNNMIIGYSSGLPIYFGGTSAACSLMSGALALLLQLNSDHKYNLIRMIREYKIAESETPKLTKQFLTKITML